MINRYHRRQSVLRCIIGTSSLTRRSFGTDCCTQSTTATMKIRYIGAILAVALIQYTCCAFSPFLFPVHCFVIVERNPLHVLYRYQQQSTTTISQTSDTFISDSSDDEGNDRDDTMVVSDDDDDDTIYGKNYDNIDDVEDEDEDDVSLDDEASVDETLMNFDDDDDDDDYSFSHEDDETDGSDGSSDTLISDLDAAVQTVLHQYMEVYQNKVTDNEQSSPSVQKMAIIQGWLPEMEAWNSDQYNQLLNEISQIGSVRDTETILYHMIQQQQDHHESGDAKLNEMVLVNDETFYHVIASHQYRQKRQQKNFNNKKNRGIGFKVEQILAIQDAISINRDESNRYSSTVRPSIQTLNAVLHAMSLDRYDNKIALRARRVWDRMLQVVTDDNTRNDDESVLTTAVLSTLLCCTHLPRSTASPADKLSSFTVALDCFNYATTTSKFIPQHAMQHCNAYTYFLRACRTLLSETNESKRDAVVEAAFRRACTNGYVNTNVVKAMEEIASDALMLRLLGGFIEDGQELPNEWSRNCAGSNTIKRVEASVTSNDR